MLFLFTRRTTGLVDWGGKMVDGTGVMDNNVR